MTAETGPTGFPSEAFTMPQEKSNRSEDISNLVMALSKAQGEIKEITKNRTVTVRPRSGGQEYSYRYATLSAIIDAIREPLSKNELAYTQTLNVDGNGYYVLTTTLHYKNEYISSETPIIMGGSSNQEFGSALTYMKRYALAAILGIAPDEDDDGNAVEGNEVSGMQESINRKAPSPAPDSIKVKAPEAIVPLVGEFVAVKIDVPLMADESGSDWMAWGQQFISQARLAPSKVLLEAFEKANETPLKNMELNAAKLYRNLTVALAKVKQELK